MTIAGVKNTNMRLAEAILLLILAPFNLKVSVRNKAKINNRNYSINPVINQELSHIIRRMIANLTADCDSSNIMLSMHHNRRTSTELNMVRE